MDNLPMAAFAAMHLNKTGPFQIADELADFARHLGKTATNAAELPVLLFDAAEWNDDDSGMDRVAAGDGIGGLRGLCLRQAKRMKYAVLRAPFTFMTWSA